MCESSKHLEKVEQGQWWTKISRRLGGVLIFRNTVDIAHLSAAVLLTLVSAVYSKHTDISLSTRYSYTDVYKLRLVRAEENDSLMVNSAVKMTEADKLSSRSSSFFLLVISLLTLQSTPEC